MTVRFERAFQRGDSNVPYVAVVTFSEAVHAHPRFVALLREMRLDDWADRFSARGGRKTEESIELSR